MQLFFHHVLGRYTGMVGSRHPQHLVAAHTFPATQDILQTVVQGMPHVQDTGDIGGWYNDGISRPFRNITGVKITTLFPDVKPFLFYLCRIVSFGQLRAHCIYVLFPAVKLM